MTNLLVCAIIRNFTEEEREMKKGLRLVGGFMFLLTSVVLTTLSGAKALGAITLDQFIFLSLMPASYAGMGIGGGVTIWTLALAEKGGGRILPLVGTVAVITAETLYLLCP